MDALVLARAAVLIGVNAPRNHVEPKLRSAVERATIQSEQAFSALREAIRVTPTFNSLNSGERLTIERRVFEVPIPSADEV